MSNVRKFTIDIPQATLDDLRERLARTRWTDSVEGADWNYGTNLDYLQQLVQYWRESFDWREQEAKLNGFAHFRTNIDELGIHFIHERGVGGNPIPLLLTHGWPDSFARMMKIIPMLTDPARFGGDAADSFDVVVPSVPGYGFSDRATRTGMTSERVGDIFFKLMTDTLSYARFGAHGGDVGAEVTQAIARAHADAMIGIHLTDLGYSNEIMASFLPDLDATEKAYAETVQQWQQQEGAYAALQSTKPQTAAYGLNDSPAGLAAWMIEKFRAWSDCNGDVESRFTRDELLTQIMIYWATETINSSFRIYYEGTAEAMQAMSQGGEMSMQRTEVPAGVVTFPKEITRPPRQFAERFNNIQRWTEMDRGGHFAALEEPELLVEDIRAFFRPLR